VLALLPVHGSLLQACYCGPFTIEERLTVWTMSSAHQDITKLSGFAM